MDSNLRKKVEAEALNLRARIVLTKVQMEVLNNLPIEGQQAERIAITKKNLVNQVNYDKVYLSAIEKLLAEPDSIGGD